MFDIEKLYARIEDLESRVNDLEPALAKTLPKKYVSKKTQIDQYIVLIVKRFMDECIEWAPGDYAPVAEIVARFEGWSSANGVKPIHDQTLGKAMSLLGVGRSEVKHPKVRFAGGNFRARPGIRFKSPN